MEYELKGVDFKDISILTQDHGKNGSVVITGYSAKPLVKNDTIETQDKFLFTIVDELERRDAKGHWINGEEKNRWYKANATFRNLTP